jgi:hypothetical protein
VITPVNQPREGYVVYEDTPCGGRPQAGARWRPCARRESRLRVRRRGRRSLRSATHWRNWSRRPTVVVSTLRAEVRPAAPERGRADQRARWPPGRACSGRSTGRAGGETTCS